MNDTSALHAAELLLTASQQRDRWLQMLRIACNTVGQGPSPVIDAMTVTASGEGLDDTQRQDLFALARLLAAEYNLQAETKDTGSHLEARLSR